MDTSQGQLAFIKETVAGTPPATPAFSAVDFVDEDFAQNVTQTRSAAVTSQRVVKNSRRTGREVGGGFRFELYKGPEIDAIMASLLGNAFVGSAPNMIAKAGGNTVDTYTFERKLSATDYRRFTGCRIGSAEFTLAPEANVMVRVNCVGFSELTDNAIITGATYTAPATTDKLCAVDVSQITLSNGITTNFDYESMTFTVNNQLQARKRLGANSIRSIGAGQALVTGNMSLYVPDKSLADAYLADTQFDMNVPILEGAVGYEAIFQNVHITDYNDNNTGNNNEFMAAIQFEATLDSAYGSSFGFRKTS